MRLLDPDAYVRQLIDLSYITSQTVVAVLVGPKTWGRKTVDWDIRAALTEKEGEVSGLIGVLLPTFRLAANGSFHHEDLPPRLTDNVKSGFAKIYTLEWFYQKKENSLHAVSDALDGRMFRKNLTDDSRKLMLKDLVD